MNINQFQNLNESGASIRSGEALLAVSLDSAWAHGSTARGFLSIYESGEEIDRWTITVQEDGEINQRSDGFYRAAELFDVLIRESVKI